MEERLFEGSRVARREIDRECRSIDGFFRHGYGASKAQREWICRAPILATLVGVALCLSAALADSMTDEPMQMSAAVSTTETTRAELPRQWQWTREPVRFDSMIREGVATRPTLDWIRSPGIANR